MLFAVCEAQARCLARRLAAAFVASPLVLSLACAAFAVLPAASLWAGRRAAPALHAADTTLVWISAAAVAALAGVVVALVVDDAVLGRQLAVAPLPPLVRVAALVLFPAAIALALAAPAVVPFAAAVAGTHAPVVCARLLAFAALGAAGAEAVVCVARRSLRCVPLVAAVAALAATAMPPLACPVALLLWPAAASLRPPPRAPRATVRVLAHGPTASAFARYGRRGEVRRQSAAAVGLAAAAALALRAANAGAAAAALGTFVAVAGAAVVPLAAPGLDRAAEWLWRSAPVGRGRTAASFAVAALAGGAAVAVLGALLSLAAAPAPPARLLPLAAALGLLLPAALLAGALVPWRADRAGEQLAAYAVFGVLAFALWLALARAAPHGARAAALIAACALACVGAAVLRQGRAV